MGKRYEALSDKLIEFIKAQKIFFVGTATDDSRVNVSPKGMDSLRVIDNKRVVWLNVTGSGNETSAHIQQNSRMTIMFCALDGPPLILRLYGSAKVIHKNDAEWKKLFALFEPLPGARQIFDLSIELIQTSCGMAVPYYEYSGDRELLNDWAQKRDDESMKQYWLEKNQLSIDDIPTHIATKNI
ncbi:MAG: pyridoxamine 5'-phosphate oxidase family protein [Methylotenera sp.]